MISISFLDACISQIMVSYVILYSEVTAYALAFNTSLSKILYGFICKQSICMKPFLSAYFILLDTFHW